uniref:Transporter n=1 Tax=Glossina palpalis gambiensis TaxID=67801 RepID=A0A1B0C4T3_9MUSC
MKFLLVYDACTATSGLSNGDANSKIFSRLPARYARRCAIPLLPGMCRGLILCICLNVTYANVVRFPRELDKFGLAYLVPYVVLLFLVGLPIVLLEISMGQFLGQEAAHTWRASPIFKGACIISRFASWVSTVWLSLHAVIATAYIGMFTFNSMPFKECIGILRISSDGYALTNNSGQECLQKTFLTPFWENPFFFGVLSIALLVLWTITKCIIVSILKQLFVFMSICFCDYQRVLLLCIITVWELHNSLGKTEPYFPQLWPFTEQNLRDSNLWFSALMQIVFAMNCGFGILPMLTGKYLYKGDAVRTSVIYVCFNLLISAVAVTLFIIQFDHSVNGSFLIEELKPLTAVYDRVLYDKSHYELCVKLLPSLIYTLMIMTCFMSLVSSIYTAAHLVPRRPNYMLSLAGLLATIISFSSPRFYIARILDARIVGTMVITALIFDLIAITWIYGAKNIYIDLEFSIGRPIFKGWMWLWYVCPAILTILLVWWCSDDDQYDILSEIMPRWAPILFVLFIVFIIACVEIFGQVEYNFFGMICEASKSAKEWGPADPLTRCAWKQWRSVCQDTGQRDFTFRRRGTKDYTRSIRIDQYTKYKKYTPESGVIQQQWISDANSPNYSRPVCGSSMIEKDISLSKHFGMSSATGDFKKLRYSRCSSMQQVVNAHQQSQQKQQTLECQKPYTSSSDKYIDTCASSAKIINKHNNEVMFIRRSQNGASLDSIRAEIESPKEGFINTFAGSTGSQENNRSYANRIVCSKRTKNHCLSINGSKSLYSSISAPIDVNAEHICWRKFAMDPREYSTEL